MNNQIYDKAYSDIMFMLRHIAAISPDHGNALMDIMGQDKYQDMMSWTNTAYAVLCGTEPCCPYDNEKCDKTGCYINNGPCSRKVKKV